MATIAIFSTITHKSNLLSQNSYCNNKTIENQLRPMTSSDIVDLDKKIEIVFHVIQDQQNLYTLNDADAKLFINEIMRNANYHMDNNKRLRFFNGSNQVVKPFNLDFEVGYNTYDQDTDHDGVLFWKQSIWGACESSSTISCPGDFKPRQLPINYDKTVVDVFLLEDYSLSINGVQSVSQTGDAFDANDFGEVNLYRPKHSLSKGSRSDIIDVFGRTLVHEVMHLLGLSHTNYNQCSDIPNKYKHDWCGSNSSNNLMDYGCEAAALSECQIDLFNEGLATFESEKLQLHANFPGRGRPTYSIDYDKMEIKIYNTSLSSQHENMWFYRDENSKELIYSNAKEITLSLFEYQGQSLEFSMRTRNIYSNSLTHEIPLKFDVPAINIYSTGIYSIDVSKYNDGLPYAARLVANSNSVNISEGFWMISSETHNVCLSDDYGRSVSLNYADIKKSRIDQDKITIVCYISTRPGYYAKIEKVINKNENLCRSHNSFGIVKALDEDDWVFQTDAPVATGSEITWNESRTFPHPFISGKTMTTKYSGSGYEYRKHYANETSDGFSDISLEVYDYRNSCKYEYQTRENINVDNFVTKSKTAIVRNLDYDKNTGELLADFNYFTNDNIQNSTVNFTSLMIDGNIVEPRAIYLIGRNMYRIAAKVEANTCDKLDIVASYRQMTGSGSYNAHTSAFQFQVDEALCIPQQQNTPTLTAYPNPSVGTTTVDIAKFSLGQNAQLCINSVDGIYSDCRSFDQNASSVALDLTGLRGGFYIISIIEYGQTITSGKILISNMQ